MTLKLSEQSLLGCGPMAKVIGEALEQFELGVDLVKVFRSSDLVRIF